MSRKLLTDAAFLPLGSQENRPFVNGSSVSAGGRGTAEAVLSCQLLPFQPKPEPSLPKPPNLEARLKLKFLLPALGPRRSIWAIAMIHSNSRGVPGTPLLHKHTQPRHRCHPQPLEMLPNPPHPCTYRYHAHPTAPLGRQGGSRGDSSSAIRLRKPHPIQEPRVQVQNHPADFPTSAQLTQGSRPCLRRVVLL